MGVHDDVDLGLIQTRLIPTTWPLHAALTAVRLLGTLPLGCINMPRKDTSNAACAGGQLWQMLHAVVLRQYVWQMLHAVVLRQYAWQMLHAVVLRQYAWQMLHAVVLRQYAWQMLHAVVLQQYVWQMLHAGLRQYAWQMLHIMCTHCSNCTCGKCFTQYSDSMCGKGFT